MFFAYTVGNITLDKKLGIAASLGITGMEIENDLKKYSLSNKAAIKKYNLKPLAITPQDVDIFSYYEEER